MTKDNNEANINDQVKEGEIQEPSVSEGGKTMEDFLTEENEALIAENEELKKANDDLSKEKDELTETLQRHQAEFENFRKRTLREKEDLRVGAAGDLLTELLPVLDNFERALVHGQDDPLYQGVKMVQKQMLDILIGSGLILIGAEGEEFDPKVHDAIAQEEKEGYESGRITVVLQPGYMFHDKLLRPAMVKVAK